MMMMMIRNRPFLVVACFAATIATTRSSLVEASSCGTTTTPPRCYLHDLTTGQETLLASSTTLYYDHVPGQSHPSIVCDAVVGSTTVVGGGSTTTTSMDRVEFFGALLPDGGVTFVAQQDRGPYWIDGSMDVLMDDWLESCGSDKTLTVRGMSGTTSETCFGATYILHATRTNLLYHGGNAYNNYGGGGTTDHAGVVTSVESGTSGSWYAGGGGDDGNLGHNNSNLNNIGDLNIRFSKITRADDASVYISPRLMTADYPVDDALQERLARETTAVSVLRADDYEIRGIDLLTYVDRVGGPPLQPNRDPNHPFWDDFRQVVQAQVRRRNGDASDLNLPKIWRDLQFNVTDVAGAIQNEIPGFWQGQLIDSFFKEGNAKLDTNVLPFRSSKDFVGGPVRMAALNAWTIIKVSRITFRLKWVYGRPRPEEVAFLIQNGGISAWAVPDDILQTLSQFPLTKQEDFTAYPEGAPRHPSWPAMHSTASMASFWLQVVLDLTDEQFCQALLTDWIVSYGRTVGGVHYPGDNIPSLNLGQEIVADILVDHLVDFYGANRTAAQAKVDAARFDWNDFDPATCRINGRN